MIYGIGIDIIEIDRIEDILQRVGNKFIEKILTRDEILGCPIKQRRRLEFIAGRFAAKEAISKAIGSGIGSTLGWKDMEILKEDTGKPYINMKNNKFSDNFIFHISISHSKSMAIAKVIVEQK